MSQAIQFNGVLTSARTRSDGSVGISVESGAFTPEDKLAVFNLQNVPCEITFKPNDADALPPKEIKGELSKRTQSERIRATLFCWWSQLGSPGEFTAFYNSETEKYLTSLKSKLKPI